MSLFEITNSRGLPMAKEATKRVTVYLTPEQYALLEEMAGDKSPATFLHSLIQRASEERGLKWPGSVGRGGKRPGQGRPPKKRGK